LALTILAEVAPPPVIANPDKYVVLPDAPVSVWVVLEFDPPPDTAIGVAP